MIREATLGSILLAAAAGVALAQGPEGPGRGPGMRRPQDEVFKMVDAYIVSNLQESLDLTDDQFVKVLPLVKRLQTDRRGYAQRRFQSLREIRRILKSGSATENRVVELLREVKSIESEEPATLRKDTEAIDAVLTPVQQAKLRVLQIEVEQKLRQMMSQVRTQRGGPGRGRREAPGEEPLDDQP